jgi:hypothetical protein
MSIDKITQQSRRPGPVPSIRVLVFAVVLSALMLAGTLVGLAAAALVMTSDVDRHIERMNVRVAPFAGVNARLAGVGSRLSKVVAAVTASAARLALPVHGPSDGACAHQRDSFDGEAERWISLQPSVFVVRRGPATISPPRGSPYAVRCSRSARARCLRAASQNTV